MKKNSSVKVIFFSSIVIFLMQNWYFEKKDIETVRKAFKNTN